VVKAPGLRKKEPVSKLIFQKKKNIKEAVSKV
jgi:hypothetical protein